MCMLLVHSNSQAIMKPIEATLARAHSMFASSAYLHQYFEHGLSKQDFVEAFVQLEQVNGNYAGLSSF